MRSMRNTRSILAIGMFCFFLISHRVTRGQISVNNLIRSAVSDSGPQYENVAKAITAFKNQDMLAARAHLETAKKRNPKLAPAAVMLAQMYVIAKQPVLARAALEQAVMNHPNDPEAYLLFADAAYQKNRLADAHLLFQKAEQLTKLFSQNAKRKRNFQLRYHAGLAAVAEKRADLAIDAQKRVLWQEAVPHLQNWAILDPDNAAAHERLGRVLFRLGSTEQLKTAFEHFKKAANANEKLPSAGVMMGRLFEQTGNPEKAVEWMKYALSQKDRRFQTHLAITQWAMGTDQLELAKKQADAALKMQPASIDALLSAGLIARMQGDQATAARHLEAAHKASPSNWVATNHLALVLAEQPDKKKWPRALEFAQLNVRLLPKNSEVASTLGWVLYRMGRENEALRVLGQVAIRGKIDADSAYYIAKIYSDKGRKADAKNLLERAVKSDRPFAHRKDAEKLYKELTNIKKKPK